MKTKTKKQLKRIAKNYSEYGVTLAQCIEIYNSGIRAGLTEESAVIGLRLGLSKVYNVREYFTSEDVAAVTGETVEQVNKCIEDNKDELMQNDCIVEVSSPLPGLFQ